MYRATYSPDDNKLRLYAGGRLPPDVYARVKGAGFSWAPKQELFVAPMWTPGREDLLTELCEEIEDEDKTLAERAEDRAERFENYSDKRAADAESARAHVERITSGIPLGQPILIGHHSEKHARKDAQRIDNGMRKAVKMWETSKYWTDRAAGALAHAKYKERPGVRARRIKGIEADQRKAQRYINHAEQMLALWAKLEAPSCKTGEAATVEVIRQRADVITNHCHISMCFTLAQFPRDPPVSQYEGQKSLWSALADGVISPQQARAIAEPSHRRTIAHYSRWVAHYDHRLAYERAMLEEQGASALLEKKPRPKQLPLCNYRAPEGLRISRFDGVDKPDVYSQGEMTAAEYAAIHTDYKGTRTVGNSHRVRIAIVRGALSLVFLTDSKTHEPPAAKEAPPRPSRFPQPSFIPREQPERTAFDAMRDTLKGGGVQIAVAPQLFPTPRELARRMVEIASKGATMAGRRVLEPSAGTGVLLEAVIDAATGADCCRTVAVELNLKLAADLTATRNRRLYANENTHKVVCADFLECGEEELGGKFDAVVMNPPFKDAQDIAHIRHALAFLKPGGRLVAVCANGPRQKVQLGALIDEHGGDWEDLPADTFKDQGTGVNTALVTLHAPSMEAVT